MKDYSWASELVDELRKQGFNPNQIMHILPNLMVESGGGRPDAVQGDMKKGFKGDDGSFDRGRGLIQLTGRKNYEHMERLTGIPLTQDPTLAAKPENAARIAAAYLKHRQEAYGNKQDLSYNSFESVYRALAPKNKDPNSRLAEIEKYSAYGWRLATMDDVYAHMPAYDPKAFTVQPDGSLKANTTPPPR